MFNLTFGDDLEAAAETDAMVNLTVFGKELTIDPDTGITTEVIGILYQGLLDDSVSVVYTVPADTTTFVTEMASVNTDASPQFFAIYTNGTGDGNRITPDLTLLAGGMMLYGENGWQAYDSDGKLRTTTS